MPGAGRFRFPDSTGGQVPVWNSSSGRFLIRICFRDIILTHYILLEVLANSDTVAETKLLQSHVGYRIHAQILKIW